MVDCVAAEPVNTAARIDRKWDSDMKKELVIVRVTTAILLL